MSPVGNDETRGEHAAPGFFLSPLFAPAVFVTSSRSLDRRALRTAAGLPIRPADTAEPDAIKNARYVNFPSLPRVSLHC